MKKAGRAVAVFLVVLSVALCFVVSAFSVTNQYDGVTSAKTPTAEGRLKFSKKLGEGYSFAPTAPVVYGDVIVVMSGKTLFKLNAKNGSVISSAEMKDRSTFTVVSPCVENGMIFVPLNNGIIQAFDFKTLKPLWVYTDPLGGQSVCNMTYSGGYIYTGFWNGETKDASFVCLSVKDEKPSSTDEAKKAKWSYRSKGGFYLTDPCVSGNFVVLGTDNGVNDSTSASKVISLNKTTGKLVSSLSVKGDVRSAVVFDPGTKRYFVVSKAGLLYSFSMSSSGALSGKKSLTLSGPATASPVIYGGRLYLGGSNGSGGGVFYVIDPSTLKKIYTIPLSGFPQAPALVSTAYEDEGKIYVYFTVNAKPGSIFAFSDSKGAKSAEIFTLYSPSEKNSQFCISRIAAGSDGTLYYKNDSGNIFAVTSKSRNFIVNFINSILAFFMRLLGKA